MTAQDGSGAGFDNVTENGGLDCVCFGGGGNHAEEVIAREQGGDGQGQGMGRNLVESRESSVVDLLLTADQVELNHLNGGRIVKEGNVRIVEGDVAVFTDTHANDVDGVVGKKLGITGTFSLDVGSKAV